MSLHYDYSKVPDADHVCFRPGVEAYGEDPKELYTTMEFYELTVLMMVVGVGVITSKTLPALYSRLAEYGAIDGKSAPFTFERLKQFEGLSTNVSNESATWWRGRVKDLTKRKEMSRAYDKSVAERVFAYSKELDEADEEAANRLASIDHSEELNNY